MASYIFFKHFFLISLIIFLTISLSNGENLNYTACSDLSYSCGKIQNISYPFWGDSRPNLCGISYFKLDCEGYNNNQNITRMFVNHNGFSKLNVTSINTSSHTLVVSLSLQHCYTKAESYPALFSTLKPNVDYKNISLYYDCSNNNSLGCSGHNNQPKSFNCSNKFDDNKSELAYYVDNPSSDIRSENKSCLRSCKNNITVPVAVTDFDEVIRSLNNASPRNNSREFQIEVKYNTNVKACSKCEESGGRCGSSLGDQFICYCRDGSNNQHECSQSENNKLESHQRYRQKNKKQIVIGIIGGFLLVLVITLCIAIWYLKKKSGNSKFRTRSNSIDSSASELERGSKYFGVPLFSYTQLVEATSNFDQSNELGSGGFGTVYYGKLKDGREVAVKRLYEKNYKRLEQFMNEIKILTRLKHDSLVLLHGCTSPRSRELLLVYEYVNNGTVADHLYGENTKSEFLPWPVRLRIAIETATALSYLHASDIVHRDVKTNNILLDSNFSVKVADFGLSRLFPTDKTHVSTAPQGTPGYLDPEYHQCYKLTNKSDVYSFGVVLIELISSLPAVDMDRHRLEINLSNYAMNRIQRCAFDELIDPQLGFATDFKVRRMTILVAELAFQCLQHDKEFRPSMEEVLDVLKKIESVDYEALQEEERVKGISEDVVLKMRIIDNTTTTPLPSPREDDHAKLLMSNHRLVLSSPISVIDKWISGSTISNNSK